MPDWMQSDETFEAEVRRRLEAALDELFVSILTDMRDEMIYAYGDGIPIGIVTTRADC